MAIQVVITEPFPDRPCDFCLALRNQRVYADFVHDEEECVTLRRISYEGYGCQEDLGEVRKMNPKDSGKLLKAVRSHEVHLPEILEILFEYFEENQTWLWQKALKKHSLLKPRKTGDLKRPHAQ